MTNEERIERFQSVYGEKQRIPGYTLGHLHDDARAVLDRIAELEAEVERLREWALERSSINHRLAHENPALRDSHIALSSAYHSLAEEIGKRATLGDQQ